ncbi:ribonuclease P protein component [Aquimarina sp. W85]|uniref:ribonuclease P protein component n=1 Tax=Aquimarina rhodophyticola TaxID=3342246 RepID=UPI00366BAD82
MQATFSKNERLKSKKAIDLLFSDGKSIAHYPIRLIYDINPNASKTRQHATVSVSKRKFKKAVDRNHIKRLLRESYRKNKYLVQEHTSCSYNFMFLYTGRDIPPAARIEKSLIKVLHKFLKIENM